MAAMADRFAQTRRAHAVLSERNGKTVTIRELVDGTGWLENTVRSYISKHWRPWLTRVAPGTYRVDDFGLISEEEFIQRQSQVKSDKYGEAAALRELLDEALQAGEGQLYEFKEAFPEQAHNLGTEIAAFATSGGGTIFLGVSDASAVIGLVGLNDPESRSDFRERVEGIARTARPAVVPRIGYLDYAGATLCLVQIPDGAEPVYYYDHRPYVRNGSESRPATPEEVKDLILKWEDMGTVADALGVTL